MATSKAGTEPQDPDEEVQYWFAFRQSIPRPAGQWIPVGPFKTYNEAKEARERAKAPDADVGVPFIASTKAEAEERCLTE